MATAWVMSVTMAIHQVADWVHFENGLLSRPFSFVESKEESV